MKQLLNGVAITVAALAIAAPAWAQAPATPPAGASTAPAPTTQMHRPVRPHHWTKGSGDATTDQLNREELARIQGGAPMAPAPMPAVPGQPSLQKGEPGAGMPSPSYHGPQ